MASNITIESLKNLCECPVCYEPYKDPRLLKCGHQFCENCLNGIVRNIPQGHIPCPVCREVTKPQHGDITTLPRSTLHQYMQELIYTPPTEEALGQMCTKCKVNKPTRHCPECTADLAFLCDKCYEVHQKMKRFAKHNTVQFDPVLICPDHSYKMVENYCYDCNTMACLDCMFDKHADHNTKHMDTAAQNARQLLSDFITNLARKVPDSNIIFHLKQAALRLKYIKDNFHSKIEKNKLAWKKLEVALDQCLETTNATILKELQKYSTNQTKITEVSVAQKQMLTLAENLLQGLSDPQVITGPRDLPRGAVSQNRC